MEVYAMALAGPVEQSAFLVIVLTGALLGLGGVRSGRAIGALLRMASRR